MVSSCFFVYDVNAVFVDWQKTFDGDLRPRSILCFSWFESCLVLRDHRRPGVSCVSVCFLPRHTLCCLAKLKQLHHRMTCRLFGGPGLRLLPNNTLVLYQDGHHPYSYTSNTYHTKHLSPNESLRRRKWQASCKISGSLSSPPGRLRPFWLRRMLLSPVSKSCSSSSLSRPIVSTW